MAAGDMIIGIFFLILNALWQPPHLFRDLRLKSSPFWFCRRLVLGVFHYEFSDTLLSPELSSFQCLFAHRTGDCSIAPILPVWMLHVPILKLFHLSVLSSWLQWKLPGQRQPLNTPTQERLCVCACTHTHTHTHTWLQANSKASQGSAYPTFSQRSAPWCVQFDLTKHPGKMQSQNERSNHTSSESLWCSGSQWTLVSPTNVRQ